MKRKTTNLTIFALLMVTIGMSSYAWAETVKIGGTGAIHSVMLLMKDAYIKQHPDDNLVIVPPIGSTGGIKALRAKAIDIAIIGRELSAADTQLGLKAQALGRTPFVFITNKNVPIKSISLTQLTTIFDGSTKHWPNGIPIRLVLRPQHDIDNAILKGMSEPMSKAVSKALMREGMIVGFTDTEAVDEVEIIPGAISTSTLGLVLNEQRKINILAMEGVQPLQKGYPYFKNLYLITRSDASLGSQKFAKFVQSTHGRRLLEQHGIRLKE